MMTVRTVTTITVDMRLALDASLNQPDDDYEDDGDDDGGTK
jgi:hypothetical protein